MMNFDMKQLITFVIAVVCCARAATVSAQIVVHDPHYPHIKPTDPRLENWHAMQAETHDTRAWRAAVLQLMLSEANWASDQLHLPIPHPIRASDLIDGGATAPWASTVINPWKTNLPNADIPPKTLLRALGFGVGMGKIDTTNFTFGFGAGKLTYIMRLNVPDAERYAQLVGKPSLINDAQAHQLALQWLAALDVDMAKLAKLKWSVGQMPYRPRGATNMILLPIYHVRFGNIHYPASGNLPAFDEPQAEVEILGTTRELWELRIDSFYGLYLLQRPLLLITNALELICTPDPPVKQLEKSPTVQTNSLSP
jgi:hypothetical protein